MEYVDDLPENQIDPSIFSSAIEKMQVENPPAKLEEKSAQAIGIDRSQMTADDILIQRLKFHNVQEIVDHVKKTNAQYHFIGQLIEGRNQFLFLR